jgi:hypothetical protein
MGTPVDKLSLAPVYIRLLFGEQYLANATAFLWRQAGQPFLVSNWHNFSGRKPPEKESRDDGDPLSATGGIPDRVECVFYKSHHSNGQPVQKGGMVAVTETFLLVGEDGRPRYLEHSFFRGGVDIAALPITLHEHVVTHYLNEMEFDEALHFYAGQEVFIIGYPFGLITNSPLPIWKRGSIASEPHALIGGYRKTFVDTATRPGMSGSFVIAQHNGLLNPGGEITGASIIGTTRKLLGIYSGRVGPSELEAQLGIVWHRDEIDEIVQKGRRRNIE